MQENVFITFESDVNGLNVGVEGLEKLGLIDKEVADSFRKTNDELNKRNALLKNSGSSMQTFVQGLQNAGKASIGLFGSKIVDDYKKSIGSATDVTNFCSKLLPLPNKVSAN